ncbi:hypothetical protein IMZ48_00595 [Candidatus Bathyarchaeota archaeon]|nr:hypothetical protein [Candidatus Bathyarchaeota archaeon]
MAPPSDGSYGSASDDPADDTSARRSRGHGREDPRDTTLPATPAILTSAPPAPRAAVQAAYAQRAYAQLGPPFGTPFPHHEAYPLAAGPQVTPSGHSPKELRRMVRWHQEIADTYKTLANLYDPEE